MPEPVRRLPLLAPPAQLRRWVTPSSERREMFSAAALLPSRMFGNTWGLQSNISVTVSLHLVSRARAEELTVQGQPESVRS